MLSDFDLEGKNKVQKAAYYLKNYGASYTVKKALRKFGVPISEESEYMTWYRKVSPSKAVLKEQRKLKISDKVSFSIVLEQGEGTKAAEWKKQTCTPVSVVELKQNMTSQEFFEQAQGEYLVLVGNQVEAAPDFLYEAARAITGETKQEESKIRPLRRKQPDIIYTDEDNVAGKKHYRPFFKPDKSLQMLLNFQYLGRCFVIKKSLFERILKETDGELEVSGNDWYDIALQAFRFAENVYHIPKVLFSNEVSEKEKDVFVRSRDPKQAVCLENYLKTENICGKIVPSDAAGFFHVEYELKKEPLVSIIIPNKDHTEDLQICLDSLRERSDYQNYEVIIAENNSEKPETFAYYDKIQQEDKRIHVVTWKGIFNYSAINNFAVKSASGELLLFLNNDTEFMDAKALRELVNAALQPNAGASGAMLYYGDRTIQHAGVIIGMGGFAAHALWSLTDRDEKYYPFSLCEREVSAVTGACLMVQREVYEKVGGMEEDFVVALNDVDFCMKIRAAGYEIIFNPYAKLYHYESKSRGYEDTVEKQARFQGEITRFQTKWEQEIRAKDPYYNPNLTLHRADYSMDI